MFSISFVFCSFVRGLLGTNLPDPTLESASPSPPLGSIWHWIMVESGNQYRIDVESMSNQCRIDAKLSRSGKRCFCKRCFYPHRSLNFTMARHFGFRYILCPTQGRIETNPPHHLFVWCAPCWLSNGWTVSCDQPFSPVGPWRAPMDEMTGRGVLDCVFLVQGFTGFSGSNPGMTDPKALRAATIASYLHPDWLSDRLRHLLSQTHYKSDTPS